MLHLEQLRQQQLLLLPVGKLQPPLLLQLLLAQSLQLGIGAGAQPQPQPRCCAMQQRAGLAGGLPRQAAAGRARLLRLQRRLPLALQYPLQQRRCMLRLLALLLRMLLRLLAAQLLLPQRQAGRAPPLLRGVGQGGRQGGLLGHRQRALPPRGSRGGGSAVRGLPRMRHPRGCCCCGSRHRRHGGGGRARAACRAGRHGADSPLLLPLRKPRGRGCMCGWARRRCRLPPLRLRSR